LTISVNADNFVAMDVLKNILTAFSEEIRVRIILLLYDSRLSVGCFVEALDLPQSTVSRHLSLMRRSGIVKVKNVKNRSYYMLNTDDPKGKLKERLFKVFFQSLKDEEPFKKDRKKIAEMKESCPAACYFCVQNWEAM
jgi:ArsR family transcriptional regulator, arsenate/arsenite/antimonite-responsive transcriptional repressor